MVVSETARPTFEPRNPYFETRVRESFKRQKIMDLLGARMEVVEAGYTEIHLPYKTELSQQHGFFHGGVVGIIADSAGGYAAFSLMGVDSSVLTVEYKVNLMAAADGELLIARGQVVKPGRTLTICHVEAFVVKQGVGKLCALMQMTLMRMEGMSDGD